MAKNDIFFFKYRFLFRWIGVWSGLWWCGNRLILKLLYSILMSWRIAHLWRAGEFEFLWFNLKTSSLGFECGGGWTRTTERIPGQIYSLLQLPLCDSPMILKNCIDFDAAKVHLFSLPSQKSRIFCNFAANLKTRDYETTGLRVGPVTFRQVQVQRPFVPKSRSQKQRSNNEIRFWKGNQSRWY